MPLVFLGALGGQGEHPRHDPALAFGIGALVVVTLIAVAFMASVAAFAAARVAEPPRAAVVTVATAGVLNWIAAGLVLAMGTRGAWLVGATGLWTIGTLCLLLAMVVLRRGRSASFDSQTAGPT